MKPDIPLRLKRNSIRMRALNAILMLLDVRINGIFIGRGSILRPTQLEIGRGTRINGKIVIKGGGVVSLGRFCAIGDGVRIISSNHAMNIATVQLALQKKWTGSVHMMPEKLGVTIGHDVWIGDGVIVLPGVRIENGAVVGAGAVVTRSVEPYTAVAGNPACPIGRRFPEEIADALQALQWWKWNERQFREASFLFDHLLTESDVGGAMKIIEQAKRKAAIE